MSQIIDLKADVLVLGLEFAVSVIKLVVASVVVVWVAGGEY
ncbi:MAG: hypothetical protein SPG61_02900 [Arcanobacterium sp.]|nr:hypothetical protein [Arcanobacterium sp.]